MLVVYLCEIDILGIFWYVNIYVIGMKFFCVCNRLICGGYVLLNLDEMVIYCFKGFDNVKGVFEFVSRIVDDDGNFVFKVVIEVE